MTVSEFRVRALGVRFRHWDRDHNGSIEQTDLEEAARRLAEAFGRAAGSPEHVRLAETCRGLWRALARHADIDLDGRISEEEYIAAFGGELTPEPGVFDQMYRELLRGVVDVADVAGKGGLEQEEFVRLMRSWYNASDSDGAAQFRSLDLDGDGFLTLDEMVQAGSELYLSDAPSVPILPPTR